MNYYGKDRSYPQAKSYAIVGDLVYFWHSVGVNIRLKRGMEKYSRLVQAEGNLNKEIQKVQTFLLNKMYQYIPEGDGEREFWYYKYKQLFIVKIRYKPDSPANPHPRFSNIMDSLYDTSYKLYDKPFKDKVINNERYVFITQMSYYLINNMVYYATYERSNYLYKLFKFMGDKELFKRNIEYGNFLLNVYEKMKTDPDIAKVFNENPYSLGIFYAGILRTYGNYITHNSHNSINPCTSKEIQIFTNIVEDFYVWIFAENNSSFNNLSSREQRQMKWLYNACALSFTYGVATYICEIELKYKDNRRLFKYGNYKILSTYKDENTFHYYTPTLNDFIEFSKLENLLNKRNQKNKITNQKDK